jgi:hypothetical protein
VNVEKDAVCGFCRTPLAILDADAVRKTLTELDAAERRASAPPAPTAQIDALLAGRRVEQHLAPYEPSEIGIAFDLVTAAIGLFVDL